MQGDFSRNTVDPRKHYRSVRMQQGRVQIDSDWNEQADIVGYLIETQIRDLLGPGGAPVAAPGFAIGLDDGDGAAQAADQSAAPPDCWIGAGRYYVDGILCENDQQIRFLSQPDHPSAALPAAGSDAYIAYLDVWQRHVGAVEAPDLREVALGGIDTTTRVRTIWQ